MTAMGAFIEWLCDCKCAGVVRMGPSAWGYGDPFDMSVAFSVTEDRKAVVKALVIGYVPWYLRWLVKPQPVLGGIAYRRAMARALAREGLKPVYERFDRPV